MMKSEQETKKLGLKRDLIFLILQFSMRRNQRWWLDLDFIEANVIFRGRLNFRNLTDSRLQKLINQSETPCICFNKDDTLLAAFVRNNRIKILGTLNGIQSLQAYEMHVSIIATKNGDERSSVDVPKTIEVVKPTKASKIKEISEHAQLQSLLLPSFVKKSKTMATFMHPPSMPMYISFYPYNNNIIAIGMDDSTVLIYDARANELIVWQCNKWISKKSCLLQLPPRRSTRKLRETEVQFHQDQKHFLALHELKVVSSLNVLSSQLHQENVQEMKIRASSSLRKNHHRDTLFDFRDFALKIPTELEAASQLRIAQFFVTQMPWLGKDLYGVHVRPVPSFWSASSKHLLIQHLYISSCRMSCFRRDGECGEKSLCNVSTAFPAIESSSISTPACN
ncbi:unnamed protein product [Camellia sinensis]